MIGRALGSLIFEKSCCHSRNRRLPWSLLRGHWLCSQVEGFEGMSMTKASPGCQDGGALKDAAMRARRSIQTVQQGKWPGQAVLDTAKASVETNSLSGNKESVRIVSHLCCSLDCLYFFKLFFFLIISTANHDILIKWRSNSGRIRSKNKNKRDDASTYPGKHRKFAG